MMTTLGIWIAAFLTIAIFSFLFKDNPFYKAAEHLYVGISAGYWLIYIWFFDIQPMLIDEFTNQTGFRRWSLLIPGVLGVMMFSRFIPNIAHWSRLPIAFTVGIGAGLGFTASFQGFILPQIKSTLMPLVAMSTDNGLELFNSLNSIILVIGVFVTTIYFYFSKPHEGAIGYAAKAGIVYIMIAFGASFGYTFMGRVSLLIGRVYFLLYDWLGIL